MHDNGKQFFISKIFKHFLERNDMKDKPIPNSYPQLQGKVEAYNKIVKNEFLSIVEDIANSYDGRTRYERYLLNHTTTHKRAWRYKWSYTI
jgi:hypothetical protein